MMDEKEIFCPDLTFFFTNEDKCSDSLTNVELWGPHNIVLQGLCCNYFVAMVVLQWLCCKGCVAMVVLQWLCCNCCVAMVVLQWLCCNSCVAMVVLQRLCCNGCVAMVVLQLLCCNGCVAMVVLQWLCCKGCVAKVVLQCCVEIAQAVHSNKLSLFQYRLQFIKRMNVSETYWNDSSKKCFFRCFLL